MSGPKTDLRQALAHVRWIGGAPDAGKTTVARRLAERLGWQLYLQDQFWREHGERATPERYPHYAAFVAMTMDERWVLRSPEEMAAGVVVNSAELFDMAVEDLLALPPEPPILAEGPWFFPGYVAPLLHSPYQAIWLVPTEDFKRGSAARRDKPAIRHDTSDPARATRNWFARDMLLADHAEAEARLLGLTVWRVDGSKSIEQMEASVEEHFRRVAFPVP
jgi:2-phosphoglycerate kinase